ncbi:S8 family peptidase [Jiangella muralis]|uniref:S8 family peptidase n=1 Tax=Jiangella muralis TaxID=702383 RepID=UPI000B03EA59|nr:S8 family serine peptidase [Jiangella muralis]
MSGRSDRSRRLLAILVAGSLLATLGAAPGQAGEAAGTGDAVTAFGAEPETTTVTLVTGDRVHVQRGADGREGIAVDPAPRPGGVVPQFHASSRDGVTRVVPSDVAALVPDRLDPALFDVTALAAQDAGATLPLILDYADDAVRPLDATPVPGTTATLQLNSVNAVAVDADPTEFGAAVLALAGARPLAGGDPLGAVEKVWLDARTEARLDRSTGQISAPAAWDAGVDGDGVTVAVLDSGIDDTHPDLAGRVDAAVNFTEDPDATDGAGHGTHVASIVAGTGAASDGDRRGVAPGARLLSGKVLDYGGGGFVSWAIAGMEWAAAEGARIVNMSLTLGPGSLDAPLLTGAVERLSAEHGTLFVIAAGNDGCDACIGSPGDAPSALTVGAVGRDDQLADFSSRGPTHGGHRLKPEVTAPGVEIAAARAGGGDPYVAYSGTSMAAPHVAGAAALLAQARPDLTGPELRAALTSTAVPADGVAVTAQGSGRIDVGRVLASPVLASGGDLSFGLVPFPGDEPAPPLRRTVEYRNTTTAPVTVDLAADVPGAAAGDLTVTPSTLTLAPGAAGSAEVVLDVAGGRPGDYAGYLLATPAGEPDPLRLPLGYTVEAEHFEVMVTAIAADGRPALALTTGYANPVIDVRTGEAPPHGPCSDGPELSWCVRVPAGTYSVMTWVVTKPAWADSDGDPYTATPLYSALVGDPEVTITGDTTLVMDAREAVEVEVATPDHETRANLGGSVGFGWARTPADGPATVDFLLSPPGAQLEERAFLQPTEDVTIGSFSASSRFRLTAPDITLDVDGVALAPSYYPPSRLSDVISQFPMLDGELTLPVADAGDGTAADVAATDLDGALALIRRSDAVSVAVQANRAAAAGAALVAVYNDVPGSNDQVGPEVAQLEVPTVRLSHEEGQALLDRLADGAVTATATGTPSSPYVYDLVHLERGRIPAELSYVDRAADLTAVQHDYGVQLSGSLTEVAYPFDAEHDFSASVWVPVPEAPVSRTDYYLDDPGMLWQHAVQTPAVPYGGHWPAPTVVDLTLLGPLQPVADGERSWLRQPLVPGFDDQQPMTRHGDQLIIPTAGFVDAAGNFGEAWAGGHDGAGYRSLFQVWHGDELLGEASGILLPSGTIALPPGEETYRIDYSLENRTPWAVLSTRTRTSWTFVSDTTPAGDEPAVVPLLTLGHDLGADLTNRLPAPRDRRGPNEISVEVGHLAGADPRVTGVTVEASYDDGASWRPLRVRRSGDTFKAHLPNRPPRGHTGFLSLRFSAADAAGNRIDQEIIRAAALPPD